MIIRQQKSDIPIHRGLVYCSPACGFNCYSAAYEQAVKEAELLAEELGTGWNPEVWENCGWNYSVSKNVATVHPTRQGSALHGAWKVVGYSAWINSVHQCIAEAKNACDALGFALQDARTAARRIDADCDALQ